MILLVEEASSSCQKASILDLVILHRSCLASCSFQQTCGWPGQGGNSGSVGDKVGVGSHAFQAASTVVLNATFLNTHGTYDGPVAS